MSTKQSSADERNKPNHLRPGRKAMFAGSDSDYRVRNGEVIIVRELIVGTEVDEECAPMYLVKPANGESFHAFEDELTPVLLAPSSDNSGEPR